MPIDYSKYPPNWKKEIRPRILARAGNCCERCGLGNYSVYVRHVAYEMMKPKPKPLMQFIEAPPFTKYKEINPDAKDWSDAKVSHEICKFMNTDSLMVYWRVVLTIAHLDHDEENHDVQDGRLAALCQRCHLQYDAPEKARRRKAKTEAMKSAGLFD